MGRLGPLRGAARADRPRAGLRGHGQQPDRARGLPAPHHQRLPRRLPGAPDRAADRGRATSTTSTASQAMQTDMLSIPGLETAHRLARLRPRDQRETAAIERLRSWDGRMGPDSIAATIYQAFTLRLAREVARAAIGDRDLAERWLDRADNGFIDPRHLALALAVAPARPLGGGRRGADRPPLGRARARRAARRARRPRATASAPTRRAGAGAASTRSTSRTRSARPTRSSAGSSTAGSRSAAARRRSPRSAGTRTTRSRRSGRPGWRMVADPTDPRALALAGLHRPVGPRREPPLRRPAAALARRARCSRWRARGRGDDADARAAMP